MAAGAVAGARAGPAVSALMPRCAEAGNVTLLPGCLDGVRVVVLPDEGDGLCGWQSVDNREAGQGGSGSPAAAAAGNLHAFGPGPFPRFGQGLLGVRVVGRQPEIRPAHPPGLPGHRRWRRAEQVHGEGGRWPGRGGCRKPRPLTSRPEGSLSTPAPCGSQGLVTSPL